MGPRRRCSHPADDRTNKRCATIPLELCLNSVNCSPSSLLAVTASTRTGMGDEGREARKAAPAGQRTAQQVRIGSPLHAAEVHARFLRASIMNM